MPFDLTDNPSGLIPIFRFVMKLDHSDLNAAFGRAIGRPIQVRLDMLRWTLSGCSRFTHPRWKKSLKVHPPGNNTWNKREIYLSTRNVLQPN
jgi:hypothetical protein